MAWIRSQNGEYLVNVNDLWIEAPKVEHRPGDPPGYYPWRLMGSMGAGDSGALLGEFSSKPRVKGEIDSIQFWIVTGFGVYEIKEEGREIPLQVERP
jgi:hypothetical protein